MRANIDLERMKTYTSANDVLVKKLLQSFINNIPGQLDQLKQGIEQNDLNQVRDMAHKLKTPFMYVGVDDIANKLANIEDNYLAMEKNSLAEEINSIVKLGSNCVAEAKELIEK